MTVLVINPNSREAVTEAIRLSLAGLPVECVTMPQNPAFIATPEDIAACGREVEALAAARPDASALVIACYAQPGLAALRARERRPVVGVQDAAVAAAIALGGPFGVIALAEPAIPRHLAHLRSLGLAHHMAAETALEAEPDLPGLLAYGRRLAAQGARSVILGCAGLGGFRAPLQDRLGLPVIDPVSAAMGALMAAEVIR